MSSRRIAVCLEVCPTMTFASALDWPGWCRAGGDEAAALRALAGYAAYTRKLGVKFRPPAFNDIAAIEELCEATAAVVGAPPDGSPVVPNGWTTRYASRRITWRVLEHAWEMQDRAES